MSVPSFIYRECKKVDVDSGTDRRVHSFIYRECKKVDADSDR